MNETKERGVGCLKIIGVVCAVILVGTVLSGIFDGITEAFRNVPWWGHIFLIIGFCYIIYKAYGN